MDVLKKLIAAEDESMEIKPEKKNRERNYFIRDNNNRIINSAARIHEESMKRNLEEEITNRT